MIQPNYQWAIKLRKDPGGKMISGRTKQTDREINRQMITNIEKPTSNR